MAEIIFFYMISQMNSFLNKMAEDSVEITQTVEQCHNLSNENQENLEELNSNVGMFKI